MVDVRKKSIAEYMYDTQVKRFVFVLFLALEFIFSVRFGYGITEVQKIDWIMILLAIYFALDPKRERSPIDFSSIILVIPFFLMGVYKYIMLPFESGKWDYTVYGWVVPLSYFLGKMVIGTSKDEMEDKTHLVITVMAVGMLIQGLLNYKVLLSYGVELAESVRTEAFWCSENMGTRSTWDVGLAAIVGLIFYGFLLRKKNVRYTIAVMLVNVGIILFNIYMQGRTMLLLAVLIFAVLAVIYMCGKEITVIVKKLPKIGFITLIAYSFISFIYSFDIGGIATWYALNGQRGGGIIKNVRINMALVGLRNIFYHEKGGWDVYWQGEILNGAYTTTHNSWVEFGRNFDIIVFLFLVLFIVLSIAKDMWFLFKHGNNCKVGYLAVGSKMGILILSVINPDFYTRMDLLPFLFFNCGVIGGLFSLAEMGDYKVLGATVTCNPYRYSTVALSLLSFALLALTYFDWWSDRRDYLIAFVIPVLVFIAGVMLKEGLIKNVSIYMLGAVSFAFGIKIYLTSRNTQLFRWGYFTEPFTGNSIDISVLAAFFIIPVAIVIGTILYYTKINKIIVTVVTTVVSGIVFSPKIFDGRMGDIKEAFRLFMSGPELWIRSDENIRGLVSSHNMWLDFARDYGLIIFWLLIAFEIWTIICLVKVIKNSNRRYVDYVLIVAFILFNYHFMFEASGFSNRYIFITGLFIYGLIAASAGRIDEGNESIRQGE